ncbi:macrophage mannose receptor 1-like [Gigantopelta aegis]|uniref:macrophage mannose receptor 1-like n=1 Tax=Gigantopelta aegis TaxID=1735272 RepID=UPI001B88CDF9|nr:macrophage mannose receptor 1-like [Gigantopelta aegis]
MQYTSVRCSGLLAIALCCISATLSCDRSKQSLWIRNPDFDDVIITGSVLSSVSDVTGHPECARECKANPGCLSYSYSADHTCRLHSVRFKKGALITTPPSLGSRYYSSEADACPTNEGYVLLDSVDICFKASAETKTRDEARVICSGSGDKLIVLDTQEKNSAVAEYLYTSARLQSYFIGLTDEQTENQFIWENGKLVGFTSWIVDEPDNYGNNEDCVQFTTNGGKWRDIKCTDIRRYICEKP